MLTCPYLVITITAIDRSVFAGLKWHFGIIATLGTCDGKHLPLCPTSIASFFPGLATRETALGLIGIASRGKKFLLFSAEGEVSPAIGAEE